MGTKGENNRTRIIEAADQLFYKHGYNQTSFSDIADVTGIPRGNFYYYFKTKDDILAAVVEARIRQYQEALASCDIATENPAERLHAFLDIMAGSEGSVVDTGCPIGSLCVELAKDTEALQSKSREVFVLLRDWMSRQFEEIGLADAHDKAMDLLSRMQGIAVVACAFKDGAYLNRSVGDLKNWINSLALSES
jgi:TetR/AcrR family transcriptional regulator, transcriptional repressor for nem operon